MRCQLSEAKELICLPRGSLVWRSLSWTLTQCKQTGQAARRHRLLPYQMSGNILPVRLAGATPFPHQSEYHPQARGQLPFPLSLWLRSLQLPQEGRRPWRKATNPLHPGRLLPGILWAWWMKPLLSRTSSKPLPQTSAWQPSANCCQNRQWSGSPGCLTKPQRKQAARLGARARVTARVELHCHLLCLRQSALCLQFLMATGPCRDSGSLRGL